MSKRDYGKNHIEWKIPLRGESGEWYPVVRVGRHIPFGYKQDENDPDLLIPIPEELEALEKGKEFRKGGYSLRQVAQWLTEFTGRSISHEGLKKRYATEEKRRIASSNARRYAEKYKAALEKIKRLEERRIGGVGTRNFFEDDDCTSDS